MTDKFAGPKVESEKAHKVSPISVVFFQDPKEGLMVQVSARSRLRPTSLMQGTMPVGDMLGSTNLRYRVEVLAGALAERLCEAFGDIIDPDAYAVEAGKVFDDAVNKLINHGGLV